MEKSISDGEGEAFLRLKDQHESQRICRKVRRETPEVRLANQ